jgi:hypothetical protein
MRISFKSKKKLFRGRRAVYAASKSAIEAQNSEKHQQRRFKAIKANKMIAVYMAQKTGSRWAATWNLAEVVDCADQQTACYSLRGMRDAPRMSGNSCTTPPNVDIVATSRSWSRYSQIDQSSNCVEEVDITMQIQSTNKNTRLGSRASTRSHVM